MTDKEFKQLTRAQLIDVIYQLQLQVDDLAGQNQELKNALEDKRIRMENAGNIADAALVINDCFRSAQNAAEQYLNEIKALRQEAQEERERLLAEARAEADAIRREAQEEQERLLSEARAEAKFIVDAARKMRMDMNAAINVILEAHGQSSGHTGDGV